MNAVLTRAEGSSPPRLHDRDDRLGVIAGQLISHPKANLARVPLASLNVDQVEDWWKKIATFTIPDPDMNPDDSKKNKKHPQVPQFSKHARDKAKAVLSATLKEELRRKRIKSDPTTAIHVYGGKAGRAHDAKPDTVIIPTWREFAIVASQPARWNDRLLIAAMGWSGLRWKECVCIDCADIDPEEPLARIHIVVNRGSGVWVREPVKGVFIFKGGRAVKGSRLVISPD